MLADQPSPSDPFLDRRAAMVRGQLAARDIVHQGVLDAMGSVPRHLFVPEASRDRAYDDRPLAIGLNQTISQPYIVAIMTQFIQPHPRMRVLDVGTGSGYQAAVLAKLVDHVYSLEILCPLADEARGRLETLGFRNVSVRCADGFAGWEEHAPYDAIVVAAAPPEVPDALVDQLAPGGRLIIPTGRGHQELILVEKGHDGAVRRRSVMAVRFVPMTGRAQEE